MNRLLSRAFVGSLVLVFLANPSPAIDLGLGILKRRAKADAPSQAKALITTLTTDPDASKRKDAAEQLRAFDPRTIPELIPALVACLQKDPTPTVRMEAVDTISRLKPIAQMAGLAMESALQTDPDPKVRDAIRAALFQYQINGYRTPPTGANSFNQSSEPPLAKAPAKTDRPTVPGNNPSESFRPITNILGRGSVSAFPQSSEPPLAKPVPPAPTRGVPKVMPSTPLPEATPVPSKPLPEIKIPTTPAVPSIPVPSVPVPPKK